MASKPHITLPGIAWYVNRSGNNVKLTLKTNTPPLAKVADEIIRIYLDRC